jgi:hypothetical protein
VDNQKIMRVLFLLVPVLLLLSIWWHIFGAFLSLALLYLMLLVLRNSGWANSVFGKPHEPTVFSQPTPQQSMKPEPPPRTNPPLGFDLTAQEYQLLSQQYQQGYQGQPSHQSPSPNAVPKEAPWQDDERPQVQQEMPQIQYSEEMPPQA